ncbi:MAG: Fe-S cluster assembly protein IscX [Planctomycetota bacterium]
MNFGWTDIDDIAVELETHHPGVDPLTVAFPALRGLVEDLPDFTPDPEHPVNEQILEAIQSAWIEERHDPQGDDDRPAPAPHNPFR